MCASWELEEGGLPNPPRPKMRPDLVLEGGGGGFWSCEAWQGVSRAEGGEMDGAYGRGPRLSHGIGAVHDGG